MLAKDITHKTMYTQSCWADLVCGDMPDTVTSIVLVHDAIRMHTTYFRCMEDAVSVYPLTPPQIQSLVDRCTAVIRPGVWIGAYNKYQSYSIKRGSIWISLRESIYPPCDVGGLVRDKNALSFPVAETYTAPQTRVSVWPSSDYIAEYLGINRTQIQSWGSTLNRGLSPFLRHANGCMYQFMYDHHTPKSCLKLLKSGTWNYYVPDGEDELYWQKRMSSAGSMYRGIGVPRKK